VFVFLVAVAVTGQAPSTGAKAVRIPRAADGKPDLSGIWQTMNTADWNIQSHSAALGMPAGMGVVEGDTLPYQPWALEKQKENYRNRNAADTDAKCFLPGVPRIMYEPYPFQISQTPKQVIVLFQYINAVRNIYMNTPHPPGEIEWWMGDSRGHWQGDTLVVDVTDFNDQTWFDRVGNFHSGALHVVERYSLTDRDHIKYEATIEDPKVFAKPWKMSMIFYRHTEPNFLLLEHECYTFEDEAAGNLTQPKGPEQTKRQ